MTDREFLEQIISRIDDLRTDLREVRDDHRAMQASLGLTITYCERISDRYEQLTDTCHACTPAIASD